MVQRALATKVGSVGPWAWALIIGALPAQEKAPPAEATVLALGAREITAHAALCTKNGFPGRAKPLWLEVLAEYAPDDDTARKALGFYRHGTVWQRDAKFEYPEADRPDPAAARLLEQRWQALATRLAAAHGELATALAAGGGDAERSRYHARRALRFAPNDGKALAASGLQQFEGVVGDALDLTVLRRSRLFERTLTELVAQEFPAPVSATRLPALDAAGIEHQAVQSEHFTVFGNLDPTVLQQAAAWAERSLLFCQQAFAGYDGFPSKQPQSRQLLFLKERALWANFVRKNLAARDVEFLVQNTSATEVGELETAAADSPQLVWDLAVRWVAQDYAGLGTDAMEEGIGHAITGLFFGRNLVFVVGEKEPQGTVSGAREQQKLTLPDLDTWRELAIELAWQTSTPAARLPLLQAAEFPADARIKAWSFCDWLLRAEPTWLRCLDGAAWRGPTEANVVAEFEALTKRPLAELEQRWRRFWTEDTPLRRAVLGGTTPLQAAGKEAPAWLAQWNRVRAQHGRAPVGWSAQLSIACKEHVDYLKANKDQRGPLAEHTQLPGKPGFRSQGRAFAGAALVWTRDKDPASAVDKWLALPGYRDALLNANVDTIGLYADAGLVVVDADRGRRGVDEVLSSVWPAPGQGSNRATDPVPAAIDVELLGAELQRLLAARGRGKQKQCGYPLSLHLYHGESRGVTCTVTSQGQPVAGQLVPGHGGGRRTAAKGLWVFYPDEPLPRGVDVLVQWQWSWGSQEIVFVCK
ncbi:MAG: CAP domain-containing protein [Planctomycetes bacterium]|nr:CAP domain-containing protein [Planctomycetota bacterium]